MTVCVYVCVLETKLFDTISLMDIIQLIYQLINIDQISKLRERGQHFLEVPDSYYDNLRKRLGNSPVSVKEDMNQVCSL